MWKITIVSSFLFYADRIRIHLNNTRERTFKLNFFCNLRLLNNSCPKMEDLKVSFYNKFQDKDKNKKKLLISLQLFHK